MTKNLRTILLIIGAILLGAALWYLKSIVFYLITAAIITIIGQPILSLLSKIRVKDYRLSNGIKALLTLTALYALVFSLFRIFVPMLVSQAQALSETDVNQLTENLGPPIDWVNRQLALFQPEVTEFDLETFLTTKLTGFFDLSTVSNILNYLTSLVGDVFIALFSITFISFFLLREKGLLKNAIVMAVPTRFKEQSNDFFGEVRALLVRYFIGIALEVLLVALFLSIGLRIIGLELETSFVIGFAAGLFNVIPYIGPLIGAALGLFLAIASNFQLDFYTGLLPLLGYTAIVFAIVQLIDNIFFQPLIYSSSVHAHPLEIFLVISIAGSIGGVLGMVAAVPLYTVLRVFAKEFFNNFEIVKALTHNLEQAND